MRNTHPLTTDPEKQQRLPDLEQAHRDCGLPVTVQRQAVFEAILEREDHPTADEVYTAVRERLARISRMTVYRILGNLVWLGLVTKTCHPGSTARFDPKIRQHHHLVCLDCGGIMDLEEERLNRVAMPDVRRFSFEIQDYHIHFRGRCVACQQKRAKFCPNRRATIHHRIPSRKTAKPKCEEETDVR